MGGGVCGQCDGVGDRGGRLYGDEMVEKSRSGRGVIENVFSSLMVEEGDCRLGRSNCVKAGNRQPFEG